MTRYMRKKDGDPFVYIWTPALEARGDFEFVPDPSGPAPEAEVGALDTLLPPPPPADDDADPLTS